MTGYPWQQGDALLATDLNAAIANAGDSGFSVRGYGATGDGVTDDTAAVTAAASAVAANGGGVLYFPAGRYLMSNAIYLASNTTARGEGAASILIGSANWVLNGNFPTGQYCFLTNVNAAASYASGTLTDHDITVEDLQFDYGAFASVSTPDGSQHQVRFVHAKNITIRNCLFQVRGKSNAVALLGTYNTLIAGCSAYDFTNCAWDHWHSPSKSRVIGCYAETVHSQQMVNWNPDGGATWVADDFILANCEFNVTGTVSVPIQIEPLQLGPGSTPGVVKDVVVQGNVFRNTGLAIRGATQNVVVSSNIFTDMLGGGNAVLCHSQFSGNPTNIVVTGNVINNPTTISGNLGVIFVATDSGMIANNTIMGSGYASYAITTQGFSPVVNGNYYSGVGNNTAPARIQSGPVHGLTLDKGVTFGATMPATQTDLSLGVMLFDGGPTNQTGLSASWPGSGNSHLNLVSGINSQHDHIINGATRLQITAAGLGFNGTAAVAKPTGVAVTAPAIHAALVSIGLIAP
jgi:hypothetical protein